MISTIVIDPPLLMSWMSERQRDQSVLLFDLEVTILAEERIRFDLNIIFQSIKVRGGRASRRNRYVGTTGAEVGIELMTNALKTWTNSAAIEVRYELKAAAGNERTLSLAPSAEAEAGEVKAKVKSGSLSLQRNSSLQQSIAYNSKEFTLTPIPWRTGVKWTYSLPAGPKAIRDFLVGYLPLFAEFDGPAMNICGRITLAPEDVRFFNSNKKPISLVRSLYMHAVLWKRGIVIQNEDGFSVRLQVEP
jgi:hypothetical protein